VKDTGTVKIIVPRTLVNGYELTTEKPSGDWKPQIAHCMLDITDTPTDQACSSDVRFTPIRIVSNTLKYSTRFVHTDTLAFDRQYSTVLCSINFCAIKVVFNKALTFIDYTIRYRAYLAPNAIRISYSLDKNI